ncbi:MAG: phage terminase small subunit P27 family [Selenomonadaceae bacterium]|nr:phage terminase small subunit P27 family [Selenomonadaceae bacterium]MBR1730685.1 phage terminase small subunit P27 family [Selenomonadaceae bacterium]
MAGRPRKVLAMSTGKISKQKRQNRLEQEARIKIDRGELMKSAPSWLDEAAAEEYKRVVEEAGKIELFDNLDLTTLAIYADNYSRYMKAAENLNKQGSVIEYEGKAAISPYVLVAEKAATQIMKCSAKLGLATTDRLRLIVPTIEEKKPNKFSEHFQ